MLTLLLIEISKFVIVKWNDFSIICVQCNQKSEFLHLMSTLRFVTCLSGGNLCRKGNVNVCMLMKIQTYHLVIEQVESNVVLDVLWLYRQQVFISNLLLIYACLECMYIVIYYAFIRCVGRQSIGILNGTRIRVMDSVRLRCIMF